jgi:hypothetical protein
VKISRSDSSAAFSASNTLPPLDEPLGPRQKIEWMAARDVLRAQPATETLLETTDVAAHRLQTGRLSHRIAHDVDLTELIERVFHDGREGWIRAR